MRAFGWLATLVFLAIGIGSAAVLHRIGGRSDGPGALVFYLGAFVGFGAALLGAKLLLFSRGPREDDEEPAEETWLQRAGYAWGKLRRWILILIAVQFAVAIVWSLVRRLPA